MEAFGSAQILVRKLAGGTGWLIESLHHQIELYCEEEWLCYLDCAPETYLYMRYAGARGVPLCL